MALPPIFPELPTRLGVYHLTKRLGTLEHSELYLATQSHVERHVIIEVLSPDSSDNDAAHFIASARKRVSSPLPHTAKVFESMVSDGIWYITQELPPGSSLRSRAAAEPPTIELLCQIIRDASELYQAAEQKNLAVTAITADGIYHSRLHGIHFLSPVIEGDASTADTQATSMQQLALLLSPYVPENVPGHTRLCTLLDWMYHGYEGQLLGWDTIGQTARTILRQLNPTGQAADLRNTVKVQDANSELRKETRRRKRANRNLLLAAACLTVIALMSQLGRLFVPKQDTPISPLTPTHILARQGETILRIQRNPVTINDYAQFLTRLQHLNDQELEKINSGIPASARDHTPDAWADMYQSALQGWTWKGMDLTLQSPITGISYWDALAYARYADATLPPANLLQQALQLAPAPSPEEWTGSHISADPVLGNCCVVLSTQDGSPQAEYNPEARRSNRTFRLMHSSEPPASLTP